LLFHLLTDPPPIPVVMNVEMAPGAEELQVIKMLFPLSESVKFSLGPIAVKGLDVVEL
jgi:hypothetical protein